MIPMTNCTASQEALAITQVRSTARRAWLASDVLSTMAMTSAISGAQIVSMPAPIFATVLYSGCPILPWPLGGR